MNFFPAQLAAFAAAALSSLITNGKYSNKSHYDLAQEAMQIGVVMYAEWVKASAEQAALVERRAETV